MMKQHFKPKKSVSRIFTTDHYIRVKKVYHVSSSEHKSYLYGEPRKMVPKTHSHTNYEVFISTVERMLSREKHCLSSFWYLLRASFSLLQSALARRTPLYSDCFEKLLKAADFNFFQKNKTCSYTHNVQAISGSSWTLKPTEEFSREIFFKLQCY